LSSKEFIEIRLPKKGADRQETPPRARRRRTDTVLPPLWQPV
jgi:hypothetical protein